jgi:hypothetical protein
MSISDQPRALFGIQFALERDHPLDAVDHPLFGFALGAIGGVNPPVPKPNLHARQRHLFAIGIEPQRHRRAGTERREQESVGTRAGIEAADVHRLVR